MRERVLADIEQTFGANELDYGRKLYLIEKLVREAGRVFPQVKITHVKKLPLAIPLKREQDESATKVKAILQTKWKDVNSLRREPALAEEPAAWPTLQYAALRPLPPTMSPACSASTLDSCAWSNSVLERTRGIMRFYPLSLGIPGVDDGLR